MSPAAPPTCELLDRLQPHADGLVAEQRRGGQRARHALHDANVLHALGHGERRHSVVRFKGTIAVYAATCRTGGEQKTVSVLQYDFTSDKIRSVLVTARVKIIFFIY